MKVTELAPGFWEASIDGEDGSACIDRAPDQALAGLVRANLRRLGIEAIVYESRPPEEQVESQGRSIPLSRLSSNAE